MTDLPATDLPAEQPVMLAPKLRNCLMCRTEFVSAWAGERICPRCKGTSTWRQGVARRSHTLGRQRS